MKIRDYYWILLELVINPFTHSYCYTHLLGAVLSVSYKNVNISQTIFAVYKWW